MVCNVCGQTEATIHLTEIMNNEMIEIHLCETCAEQQGTEFKTHFNFNKLLAGLAADLSAGLKPERGARLVCKTCGMTQEDFGRTGRLGCADCYRTFEKFLIPLLKRVQREVQHVGKVPTRAPGAVRYSANLREFQERLRRSIQNEAFEEAARLRDQIRELEEKMKKESKKTKGKSCEQ